MKKFYLAYGSNLNVEQMQFRCPDARIVGTAEIPNYQLLFKGSKTGSYLTIEPKQGCTVPAAVWSVSERDELALDRYEGYPHFYYKTELELPLAETGKKLTAFVYIMHEERKQMRKTDRRIANQPELKGEECPNTLHPSECR